MTFKTFIFLCFLIGFAGFVFLFVLIIANQSQPIPEPQQVVVQPAPVTIETQPRRSMTLCTNGPLGVICTTR